MPIKTAIIGFGFMLFGIAGFVHIALSPVVKEHPAPDFRAPLEANK